APPGPRTVTKAASAIIDLAMYPPLRGPWGRAMEVVRAWHSRNSGPGGDPIPLAVARREALLPVERARRPVRLLDLEVGLPRTLRPGPGQEPTEEPAAHALAAEGCLRAQAEKAGELAIGHHAPP